eukprot:TRINITY_DN11642_c0_g1_i1.p7 TRINITY_DN11642_c0_g1~~TRINITY_DN11642_c0_g1_i1.p7  ORF type:complete len:114 (-),score=0.59 TRINITY_DN11642_c0_g1_i1:436-777(-)
MTQQKQVTGQSFSTYSINESSKKGSRVGTLVNRDSKNQLTYSRNARISYQCYPKSKLKDKNYVRPILSAIQPATNKSTTLGRDIKEKNRLYWVVVMSSSYLNQFPKITRCSSF